MSSICISNCVNDTRIPVRATYINLYKWPESDAEFVKTVSMSKFEQGRQHPHQPRPRVVDGVSCRQIYLRSYTFSRKESVPEKTKKCLGRVKDKVTTRGRRSEKSRRGGGGGSNRKRAKEYSCSTLRAIFRRLLSCTTSIDVVANCQ